MGESSPGTMLASESGVACTCALASVTGWSHRLGSTATPAAAMWLPSRSYCVLYGASCSHAVSYASDIVPEGRIDAAFRDLPSRLHLLYVLLAVLAARCALLQHVPLQAQEQAASEPISMSVYVSSARCSWH